MNSFRQFLVFIRDIIHNRQLIVELAKNDFKKKYLSSYLGILWAFVQPTITILIFWFVFEMGFKSKPAENFPFILWLLPGIISWFLFSEALLNSTGSILSNRYLVNNVVFRVSVLPLIKIISAVVIHLFFIIFVIGMFLAYGYSPTLYYLQLLYYTVACIVLLIGLSWITSSLVVFVRDIEQVVSMILQFGFWGTPIFWSLRIMPEKYQFLFKLNPVFYIIEGYRNTFIYHRWFWEDPVLTVYFWGVTLAVFAVGALVFKRLRPHFADVL